MNIKYITLIIIISISFLGCIESKDISQTSENDEQINLLFVYSPNCIHCIRTIPVIDDFRKKHDDVNITCVKYNELTEEQAKISDHTQYVPVIIFYKNNNISEKSMRIGEISLEDLETIYNSFSNLNKSIHLYT